MSDPAKRLTDIPAIFVNPAYLLMLNSMLIDAHRWMNKANGELKAYKNPIGKMLAKELAIKSLDGYFKAIDDLLPDKPNDKPTEPA